WITPGGEEIDHRNLIGSNYVTQRSAVVHHPGKFPLEDIPSHGMVVVPPLRALQRFERLLLETLIRNVEYRPDTRADQYEENRECYDYDDIFLFHGNNIPNSIISTILTHVP